MLRMGLLALLLVLPVKSRDRFDSLFQYYNLDGRIHWKYAKAQAMAESAMDPKARSHAGAVGLTQFMPATWDDVMTDTPYAEPTNPEDSIRAQSLYMRRLLRMFDGDLRAATAAYNWGPGRVARAMQKHGDRWLEHAPEETRKYVPRIEGMYRKFCDEGDESG